MEEAEGARELRADEPLSFCGYTKWEYTTFCCCGQAIRTLPNNAVFLGHWEARWKMPTFIYFLIVTTYLIAMLVIFPHRDEGAAAAIVQSILVFLVSYSYTRVIIDGPGWLPFFFPLPSPPDPPSFDDSTSLLHSDGLSPSGITATREQEAWAKAHRKPNRCIFSKSGRRIVIRPDHNCGWTASWIGKRNHKLFVLTNLWSTLYAWIFVFYDTLMIVDTIVERSPLIVIYLPYWCVMGYFAFMTGCFVLDNIQMGLLNQTSWERWNGIDPHRFDRGWRKNVEDICGPLDRWYCYICPVSPWTDVTNEEFITDYPPYRDGEAAATDPGCKG